MLVNKELLNHHFIIPRSSNSKFIKYLIDMGLKPIVKILDPQWDEQIGYLVYKDKNVVIDTPEERFISFFNKHRVTSQVWIRPLTISEIKTFLNNNPFINGLLYNTVSIYNPFGPPLFTYVPVHVCNSYILNSYLFEIDRDRL